MTSFLAVVVAILISSSLGAFAETEAIDFDNQGASPREILDRFKNVSDESTQTGIPEIQAYIKTGDGAWKSVGPKLRKGKETNYEFPLGTIVRWTLSCRTQNPNPNPNYWSAQAFYELQPGSAGERY